MAGAGVVVLVMLGWGRWRGAMRHSPWGCAVPNVGIRRQTASLRCVKLPLGSSGNFPSLLAASAAIATELTSKELLKLLGGDDGKKTKKREEQLSRTDGALQAFALLAVAVAFLSASQDVVIDAYRTDLLPAAERGLGSSVAVLGYRLAMILSGGIALIWTDPLQGGGWTWPEVYRLMAALMVGAAVVSALLLPPDSRRWIAARLATT